MNSTFVLVLIFVSNVSAPAISIPGYRTQDECRAAAAWARDHVKEADGATQIRVAFCLKGPEADHAN